MYAGDDAAETEEKDRHLNERGVPEKPVQPEWCQHAAGDDLQDQGEDGVEEEFGHKQPEDVDFTSQLAISSCRGI